MFQDKNNLIIISLIILLVCFILKNKETFQNSSQDLPIELVNTIGNFKNFCKDIKYDKNTQLLTADCLSRDGTTHLTSKYSFLNPCRVLNYNKRRQELFCHSQI